jgi:hypothetical protein
VEAARLRLSNGPIFTSGGIEGAQCSLVRRLALLHLLFLRVVVILLGGLLVFFSCRPANGVAFNKVDECIRDLSPTKFLRSAVNIFFVTLSPFACHFRFPQ